MNNEDNNDGELNRTHRQLMLIVGAALCGIVAIAVIALLFFPGGCAALENGDDDWDKNPAAVQKGG
jgi:hypothetical protein